MTQKDYIVLAQAIKDARPIGRNTDVVRGAHDAINNVAQNIADACARDNPRFSRAKFLAACGIE